MHVIVIIGIVGIVAYAVWKMRAHERKSYDDAIMKAWREALSDPNLGQWKQATPLSEQEEDRRYEEHRRKLVDRTKARGEYED